MAKSSKNKKDNADIKEFNIENAYQEALARFGQRENITGIDIGYKYKDGEATNQKAIRLHVKEKFPASALEEIELFPQEINGFPVDVLQANYKAGFQNASALELVDRTQRFATIQPGISIGHENVTAGTLGVVVRDNRTGKPAILSNWHVLAGNNTAQPGDDIMQPGKFDGGRTPRDTVAKLERMILDKDGDAAIALLTNDRPFSLDLMDLDLRPTSLEDPVDGDIVIKSGRTTQVTRGKVDGKGRYFITYSVGRVGIDGFRITTIEQGNPGNVEISKGGDSGSAWIMDGTSTMAGLHFAGETDPRPEEEHAIACFATTVFSRLSISLIPVAEEVENAKSTNLSNRLAAELGKATISNILNQMDVRQIRLWSRLLERSYPRLVNGVGLEEDLNNAIDPSVSPFGLVAIGFASGAVSKLINGQDNNNISSETFSIAVSAFLAGAIAGSKSVDGKL